MSNLLSANFSRMYKNKLYWTEIILSVLFGIILCVRSKIWHSQYHPDSLFYIDQFLFFYAYYIGLFSVFFCSMFLGNEYSSGTIRNKLIAGHTRHAMYLASLTVCAAACLMVCLSYLITYCTTGFLMGGRIKIDMRQVIIYLAISIALVIAYVSIYTIIAMLTPSKATASVVCIITFIVLICITLMIIEKLNIVEYHKGITIGANGARFTGGQMPNPMYLSGSEGEFYKFIFDFLPTGQGYQLSAFEEIPITHLWRLPLCSLFIAVTTTLCGILIFRKKDLK
jgi:ABC-2 type transport system permease protein